MKKNKVMIIFFTAFIFFAISISQTLAQDTIETAKEIKKVFEGGNSGGQNNQTESDKGQEEASQVLLKAESELDTTACDEEGEKCCAVNLGIANRLPNINLGFLPGGKNITNKLDELKQESKTKNQNKIGICQTKPIGYESPEIAGNVIPIYSSIFPSHPTDLDKCTCLSQIPRTETLCAKVNDNEKSACFSCVREKDGAVWSALGCIKFSLQGFLATTLPQIGIGLAGVISLLCIIYSAFTLQISGGNPEAIKKSKERLTACIIGLLFIIFVVFLLKLVGVDILQIPGFG